MKLVKPISEYKNSFLDALMEYQKEEVIKMHNRYEHYNNLNINLLKKNFQSYINKELDKEKGIGLPEGYVPESVFWLINENEFIGKINIRHRLTDSLKKIGGHIGYDIRPSERSKGYGKEMLRLALIEAKKLGINEVLITCNFDNIPSRKVIESNGGIFQSQEESKLKFVIKNT